MFLIEGANPSTPSLPAATIRLANDYIFMITKYTPPKNK